MDSQLKTTLLEKLSSGTLVPYLGPGALDGVTGASDDNPIPADSESLILAMNNGQPMAPRLMYEFPRAAMNLELKKGRPFIERFLTETYAGKQWSGSALHAWLASLKLPYLIDVNRDLQLQHLYRDAGIAHTLIVGVSRITGTDYRFRLYEFSNGTYREVDLAEVNSDLPILFKPMGSPEPEPNYVASDADYVDYITELMGGFAIPAFLKLYRQKKQYLFLGMRMLRDTERMVLSDIIYGASEPRGWVMIAEPTDKERRFCDKLKLSLIEEDWTSLVPEGVLKEEATA